MTKTVAWLSLLVIVVLTARLWGQDERALGFGKHTLVAAADEIAVGLAGAASRVAVTERTRAMGAEVAGELRGRDVILLRVSGRNTRDELVAELRGLYGVRFAHPVFRLGGLERDGARYLLTDEVVVRYRDDAGDGELASALEAYEADIHASLDWLPRTRVLRVGVHTDAGVVAAELAARPGIEFAHVNWLRELPLRHVPNDPLFANQWHLRNTGQGSGVAGADIRATGAWDYGRGLGRTIAVIDTGVDSAHYDLLRTPLGYNPLTGAGPTAGDDTGSHGTSCAGVAAARGDNGTLVAGVAPSARVMPIRLLDGSGFGTPTDEAACFTWAADNGADVISCSWGPDGVPFPLPPLVEQALVYVTTSGRGGLGAPIFWAAGNGSESTAADEYVASPLTVAVGASTNFDVRAAYSDYGAALDLMAPSSGGTRGIDTTIPGNGHTLFFGGTSAAAPQAAGTAALMLEIAPQLTWTNVRDILRASAVKIQPATAAYDAQGHSSTYGYGRLDAEQAVIAAAATNVPPMSLRVDTAGVGDIRISITGMAPHGEFLVGISQHLYTPLGGGPVLGVGTDALMTLREPPGTVPFHAFADNQGDFFWGWVGVPAGVTIQGVAVTGHAGGGLRVSNIVQTSF